MHIGNGNYRQSVIVDLQEQIDSIAPNKYFTQVAAAGSKGLLKIFAIEENGFSFVADFRSVRSRRLNLMYSASHVSWSHIIDNIIATTSTNGAVVLWNVDKAALHRTYKAHTRSATKVCFHHTDRNTLISGAKDAAVIQYDFRMPEPVKKFMSGSCDPIRDMQFGIHPSHYDIFVAADDGGSVRFWDLRKNDRPLHQFVAHHGPFSVALNPNYDDQNLIATAGRDKFIRIWKWFDRSESQLNSSMYSVEATASVSRVYWRPMYKYQVASCSVVSDINIHVWDIRRPFLPFASFDEHRDICSDLAWKEDDSEIFLSAGKDGLLVMHFVENAHHPMNHVSDVAVDISPAGTIAVAVSSQLSLKNESLIEQRKARKGEAFAPRRRKYDPFQSSIPSYLICCEPTETNVQLSPQHFITLARRYKLYGEDASSLCFHNSRVAENIKKYDIAHTWRIVGFICSFTSFFEKASSEEASPGSHENTNNNGASASDAAVRSRFPSSLSSGGMMRNVDGQDVTESIFSGVVPQIAFTSADFFFGDNELNLNGLNIDSSEFTLPYDFKAPTNLKMEAFTPRPYEEFEAGETSCSLSSEEHLDDRMPNHTSELKRCQIGNLRIRTELACTPSWDPLPLLCSMFNFYSDLGDVQTCVSVLLILGEKSKEFIDLGTQKLWFLDYIDMLECYELWNTAAEVIKLCWIAAVNSLSNESTSIKLLCTKCKTVSVTSSPYCKKCLKKFNFNCSLCSLPVHGIWSWCRGCTHGGHPQHYAEWFALNKKCPTGCGHSCVQ
ncbi:WD domain G-beta repeat family protein [Acanthocheilonema viteae]